jgi:hypothetical protein
MEYHWIIIIVCIILIMLIITVTIRFKQNAVHNSEKNADNLIDVIETKIKANEPEIEKYNGLKNILKNTNSDLSVNILKQTEKECIFCNSTDIQNTNTVNPSFNPIIDDTILESSPSTIITPPTPSPTPKPTPRPFINKMTVALLNSEKQVLLSFEPNDAEEYSVTVFNKDVVIQTQMYKTNHSPILIIDLVPDTEYQFLLSSEYGDYDKSNELITKMDKTSQYDSPFVKLDKTLNTHTITFKNIDDMDYYVIIPFRVLVGDIIQKPFIISKNSPIVITNLPVDIPLVFAVIGCSNTLGCRPFTGLSNTVVSYML